MTDKVLLVDDDENVLQGYYRNLKKYMQVDVALGGEAAIRAVEDHGPYAVIVADMRMPGMTGLDVLKDVQNLAPSTTRIMLTGNSDQQTATDAVNQGRVFRFLTKPIAPEHLLMAIQAGIRQFHLVQAEQELLDQTLKGSIHVLLDLLSSLDPACFGKVEIMRDYVMALGRALGVENEWTLEVATFLAPIGRIALPPELLAKLQSGASLTLQEQSMVDEVPSRSARLLSNIPRLEEVARIVRYQSKGFDGSGFPMDMTQGEEIPLEARILRVVGDFTEIALQRKSRAVALEELRLHRNWYDPRVLAHLGELIARPSEPDAQQALRLAELFPGMPLAQSVHTKGGRLVLLAGQHLTPTHLEMLKALDEILDLQEPIYVGKV